MMWAAMLTSMRRPSEDLCDTCAKSKHTHIHKHNHTPTWKSARPRQNGRRKQNKTHPLSHATENLTWQTVTDAKHDVDSDAYLYEKTI